jgi:probable F420-dependent oxidoreductase
MKIDVRLSFTDLGQVPGLARAVEVAGFDGLWSSETTHDPFLCLALAAEHTARVEIGPAIAVAFGRSPLVVAHTAWDLAAASRGRFILGLGSQVRGHIERRFGLKWEAPSTRMREFVGALRAIWRAWQERAPLKFQGRFYTHTLMPPFFDPGPQPFPRIPIYLAAVTPPMLRVAGELCDGVHVHPLHTARFLREVVRPNLARGAARAGRAAGEIGLAVPAFVATGATPAEVARAAAAVRQRIAFYASTRTYQGVMDLHGWTEAAERLRKLSIEGKWEAMGPVITDAMLEEFAVSAPYAEVPARLQARYAGLADRLMLYLPYPGGAPEAFWQAVAALKG